MQKRAIFTQIQEDLELLYQFRLPVDLCSLVCGDDDIDYMLKSGIISEKPVSNEEVYYREKDRNIELSIYLSDKITSRLYSNPKKVRPGSYDYACMAEGFSHAFHILRRKFYGIKTTKTGLEAIGEIDKFCLVSLDFISGCQKSFKKKLLQIVFEQFFGEINLLNELPETRKEIYEVAFRIARFEAENNLSEIILKEDLSRLSKYLINFSSLSLPEMVARRDLPLAS